MAQRFTIKIFAKLLILTAVSLALSSCEPAPKHYQDNNTIIVLYPGGNQRIFNPSWDDSTKYLIFSPLIAYTGGDCDLDTSRGMADAVVPSADRREWTITLKKNMTWHDGEPVTAHDIKFTIDLWNHPDVRYYGGSHIDGISVIDDLTMIFNFNNPTSNPISRWDVFYPRHLLKDLAAKDFFKWKFWETPIGNGPYRYVRNIKGVMIELSANPDYFLGQPKIAKYIIKFGAGDANVINELKSGNVDIIPPINPMAAMELMDDDRYVKQWNVNSTQYHLGWNHKNPLFADKHVRQALTHAIDRKALHKMLMLPSDLPLSDSPYSMCQFVKKDFAPALEFNTAKAMELLDSAGWKLPEGDELRQKNEEIFIFTLLVNREIEKQAAVFIQAQFKTIGVQMDILPLSQSSLRERTNAGNFDATILKLWGFSSKIYGENGVLGYENKIISATINRLEEIGATQQEVSVAYHEMAPIILDEIPSTYLFPPVNILVYNNRIKSSGDNEDPYFHPYSFWIEE